jgi:hypothetical protein
MRSKFLSVIVSFLLVTISFTACLNSNEYEYSSDATVHAFGLDTIYGKHYKFTIDQVRRLIYNADSLPAKVRTDSLLRSILIDTFSVTGYITSGAADTVVNISDSVNLIPAIREVKNGVESGGMLFHVMASDGVTKRQYELQIRVHTQDPDSMVWTDMKQPLDPNAVVTRQKAVILNGNRLLVYLSATELMEGNTEASAFSWRKKSAAGLPDDTKLYTLTNINEALYIATQSGALYRSVDGETWQIVNTDAKVVTPVAYFRQKMIAVLQDENGQHYFAATTDGGATWTQGEPVPEQFPLDNISSTQMTTNNNLPKLVITGYVGEELTSTTPWSTMDGLSWAALSSGAYCPYMQNPFIMYYGGTYYIIGDRFTDIYTSTVGLAWAKTKHKVMLPKELYYCRYVSMAIDKNDFVWMVVGQKTTYEMKGEPGKEQPTEVPHPGSVWRGRINRLGFDRH